MLARRASAMRSFASVMNFDRRCRCACPERVLGLLHAGVSLRRDATRGRSASGPNPPAARALTDNQPRPQPRRLCPMSTHPRSPEYARVLEENQRYVDHFDRSKLPMPPGRGLAIVACMDARLTVEDVLGLRTGDAHIIRNAGGLIDRRRAALARHQPEPARHERGPDHRAHRLRDAHVQGRRRAEAAAREDGKDVDLPLLAFSDVDDNLRKQVDRVKAHPWLKPGNAGTRSRVRGGDRPGPGSHRRRDPGGGLTRR